MMHINKKFLLSIAIVISLVRIETSANADDIKEFEIEGMSIGDSALRYFDKGEIDNLPSAMKGEYKKSILQR